MKLTISREKDSRGFWLRSKVITIGVHGWSYNYLFSRPRKLIGWRLLIKLGKGAGYLTDIGPFRRALPTMYVGWRTKGGKPGMMCTPRLFCAGITRTSNEIPYGFKP